MTFKALTDQIRDARRAASTEAKTIGPWVRSRGTYLATADANGNQVGPRVEAECPEWDGTLRAIRTLVNEVTATYPDVASVYVSGGYDAADTFEDLHKNSNYEPWAGAWNITVWTRDGGFNKGGVE